MDATRFDRLTRSLIVAASRRGLLRGLSAAFGLAAMRLAGSVQAKKKKRKSCKKKRCGVCARCKKGRCRPLADDTLCNGDGRCRNGRCNPRPTCFGFPYLCLEGEICCGGGACPYDFSTCPCSARGDLCQETDDCCAEPPGLTCVGYVCSGPA